MHATPENSPAASKPAYHQGPLGWATDLLVAADEEAPGVLRRAMAARPRLRQSMFHALAAIHTEPQTWKRSPGWECWLYRQLRDASAADIVRSAWGCRPVGLLGGLERIGPAPLGSPTAYARLQQRFAHGLSRAEATTLRYCGPITDPMLAALEALDPRWVHPEVVRRLRGADDAEVFNASVAFLQSVCSTTTDDALRIAFGQMRDGEGLAAVFARLVRKADLFPEHPTGDAGDLRALSSADDLSDAARRYKNCLRERLLDALSGNTAYAEFQGAAILEFRRLSDARWLLYGVYGVRNRDVSAEVRRGAEAEALKFGIPRLHLRQEGNLQLQAFKAAIEEDGVWDWMF